MRVGRVLCGAAIAVAAVAVVGMAGAAQATSLAGLKMDPARGEPGADLRLTGTWFTSPGDARYASVSPVEIRWGGDEGAVVAVVEPDEGGTFITPVTVPADATDAVHLVVAHQTVRHHDGRVGHAPGTPARAVFTVGTSAVETSRPAVAATAHPLTALRTLWPVGLAAGVGLAMLVGAAVLLGRDLSRRERVQAVSSAGGPDPRRPALGQ